MTVDELQILSVLDAIELNNRATQRDLSRATGLNLAKVNMLLGKLKQKGQVKLRNVSKSPNKLRYLYVLTPRGIVEKSRLTVRFAARTWRDYSRTIARLQQSLHQLAETGATRVLLLKANEVTHVVIEAGRDVKGLSIVGIIDPSRQGETIRGIPVLRGVRGVPYDRAIPCDDNEFPGNGYAASVGIPDDKLWLV